MIKIRRFEPQDKPQIVGMIQKIMNQEFQEEQQAYPVTDLEDIQTAYGGIGEAFFVASNGEQVVGTVAIKKENDRIALLRRLFVSEPYRKQKVGKLLIDRALDFCDEMGYEEVIFKATSRMEAATKICQKSGFAQRAKIQLGSIELLKLSLLLPEGWKKIQA